MSSGIFLIIYAMQGHADSGDVDGCKRGDGGGDTRGSLNPALGHQFAEFSDELSGLLFLCGMKLVFELVHG